MPTLVELDTMASMTPRKFEEMMLANHPQLSEGTDHILQLMEQHCRAMDRPARIMILGFVTEHFTDRVARVLPNAEIIAHQFEPAGLEGLRKRFHGTKIKVLAHSTLDEGSPPVDILLSRGHHHHMPKAGVPQLRNVLTPKSVFLVVDEFCPEYCDAMDTARISNAELIYLACGYVLTARAEVDVFEQRGEIPEAAVSMEWRRRHALWKWYKYVVDYAMERQCVEAAIDELRATHDDLQTTSPKEHKLSPLIFEREMALAGYKQISKRTFEPGSRELQSIVAYELQLNELHRR